MEGLIVFAAFAAGTLAIWASLAWVLGPLNRAAENRQYPIQYGLADLLCLFVLVQLLIGSVHLVLHRFLGEGIVVLDVLLGIMGTLLWWNSARMLSRAGVHTVWRRCVVLTVVVSGIIAGPVALIALPFVAMVFRNSLFMLGEIPVVGIIYGLGRFTRATVALAQEGSCDEETAKRGRISLRTPDPVFLIARAVRMAVAIAALAVLAVILVFFAVAGAVIYAPWACLNWVLGPLDRAAKNRQFPIQFGLADLLCLFVLVQLTVGVMNWTLGDVLGKGVVVVDVLLGVVAGLVWWVCWRTLSRAGIHVVWQRCVVLALALPAAYVSSLGLIVLPFVAGHFFVAQQPAIAVSLLIVEIILPFILYGLSRFTRAVVASTKNVVRATLVEETREPTDTGEQ